VPGADDVKPPLVPIGVHYGVLWHAEPRVVADVVVAGTLTTPGLIPASPKRTLRDYAGALPRGPDQVADGSRGNRRRPKGV
jgi:hypothetical protein